MDVFEKIMDEMVDLSSVPTDEKMRQLQQLGERLVELDTLISESEENTKKLREEKNTISQRLLVDLMNDAGVDHIGLRESGVDLVLSPYYHASISKDLSDEERQAAFAYLESVGGGDLIKTVLSVASGRSSLEKMRHLQERVVQMLAELELEASVSAEQSVAWNSLTSFVREQVESGIEIDAARIGGATIGEVVKIKKRKK